jgi:hypothetical protein
MYDFNSVNNSQNKKLPIPLSMNIAKWNIEQYIHYFAKK